MVDEVFSTKNGKSRQYLLAGQRFDAPGLASGLYLVATPIGNLDDMTIRAVRTLAAADLIACEDTRTTSVLRRHYGISAPVVSYNDRNGPERRPALLKKLREGAALALVSDAGTPLISDPGYVLVREALDAGVQITPLPGACAAIAALTVSGCATDSFVFAGFLPARERGRVLALIAIRDQLKTAILFESPNRILALLDAVGEIFGPSHRVSVSREISKLHESQYHGALSEVRGQLAGLERIRGEIVLVIDKFTGKLALDAVALDAMIVARLETSPLREVARDVAAELDLPRRDIYQRALALSGKLPGGA